MNTKRERIGDTNDTTMRAAEEICFRIAGLPSDRPLMCEIIYRHVIQPLQAEAAAIRKLIMERRSQFPVGHSFLAWAESTTAGRESLEEVERLRAENAHMRNTVGDSDFVAYDNSEPPQLWCWRGRLGDESSEPVAKLTPKMIDDVITENSRLRADNAAYQSQLAAISEEACGESCASEISTLRAENERLRAELASLGTGDHIKGDA